jgi:hypothetical protein
VRTKVNVHGEAGAQDKEKEANPFGQKQESDEDEDEVPHEPVVHMRQKNTVVFLDVRNEGATEETFGPYDDILWDKSVEDIWKGGIMEYADILLNAGPKRWGMIMTHGGMFSGMMSMWQGKPEGHTAPSVDSVFHGDEQRCIA